MACEWQALPSRSALGVRFASETLGAAAMVAVLKGADTYPREPTRRAVTLKETAAATSRTCCQPSPNKGMCGPLNKGHLSMGVSMY